MDTKRSFNPEESLDPEENFNKGNSLLKPGITSYYGLTGFTETGKLDQSLENNFLNTGSRFENAYREAGSVKVYDRLQRPVFENAERLTDKAVSRELNRMRKLMNENAIDLDCICSYDDRTIYRFITEELFHTDLVDIEVPGIVTQFVYEEFHPNHDHDLRRISNEFVGSLLNRSCNFSNGVFLMTELISSDGHKITEDYFIKNISLFQSAWSGFENISFKISKAIFDMEKKAARVEGTVQYDAISDDNYRQHFAGNVRFSYIYDNCWCLYEVLFPGFSA